MMVLLPLLQQLQPLLPAVRGLAAAAGHAEMSSTDSERFDFWVGAWQVVQV